MKNNIPFKISNLNKERFIRYGIGTNFGTNIRAFAKAGVHCNELNLNNNTPQFN
jgi:hypothetical protein